MNEMLKLKKILLFSCLFNAGGYCSNPEPATDWIEQLRNEVLIPERESFFVVGDAHDLRELRMNSSIKKAYILSNVDLDDTLSENSHPFSQNLECLVIEGGPIQKYCRPRWFTAPSNLHTVVLGVETIESYAFEQCRRLEKVVLSDSLRTIKDSAFCGCTSLQQIKIPSSVTYIGGSAFRGCTSLQQIEISPSAAYIGSSAFSGCTSLQQIEIPSSVTVIEEGAFSGCKSLQQIEIPPSVTVIEWNAFRNCTSLQRIEIPPSVRKIGVGAFSGCTSLQQIEIPSSVKKIGVGAFFNSELKRVDLSQSSFDIKLTCDDDCRNMLSHLFSEDFVGVNHGITPGEVCDGCEVIFPNFQVWRFNKITMTWMHDIDRDAVEANRHGYAVIRSVNDYQNLPEDTEYLYVSRYVTLNDLGVSQLQRLTALKRVIIEPSVFRDSIPSGCFFGCSNLERVFIPDNICSIGSSAFENCGKLNLEYFPKSLTTIGPRAFQGCTSLQLKNVCADASIRSIGDAAFSGCRSLNMTIPSTVVTIGSNAFEGCISLNTRIPSSVITIGSEAFKNCTSLTCCSVLLVKKIGYATFQGCPLLNIRLKGTESIGDWAFDGCTSLSLSTIPNTVTTIGVSAFDGCTSLSLSTLPESLEKIGHFAFRGCAGLSLDTIPSKVTSIGVGSFAGCRGIEKITLPAGLDSIGRDAFSACSSLREVVAPRFCKVTFIGNGAFGETGLTNLDLSKCRSLFDDNSRSDPNALDYLFGVSGSDSMRRLQRARRVPSGCTVRLYKLIGEYVWRYDSLDSIWNKLSS